MRCLTALSSFRRLLPVTGSLSQSKPRMNSSKVMKPFSSTSTQSNMMTRSCMGTSARRWSFLTWKGVDRSSRYSCFSRTPLPSLSAAVKTSLIRRSRSPRNSSSCSKSFCSCCCRTSSMLSLTTPVITLSNAQEERIVKTTHTGFIQGKALKMGFTSLQYWLFIKPKRVKSESGTVEKRACVSASMVSVPVTMPLPMRFVISRAQAYKATMVSTSTQNMLWSARMMPTARW
mmetsp:Transcript_74815/g.167871  ORF Transcript_74815/g.167871 Transcript_74815/m.167871 type:complete len:231 (+) Transcript_74815:574-1266(+)